MAASSRARKHKVEERHRLQRESRDPRACDACADEEAGFNTAAASAAEVPEGASAEGGGAAHEWLLEGPWHYDFSRYKSYRAIFDSRNVRRAAAEKAAAAEAAQAAGASAGSPPVPATPQLSGGSVQSEAVELEDADGGSVEGEEEQDRGQVGLAAVVRLMLSDDERHLRFGAMRLCDPLDNAA